MIPELRREAREEFSLDLKNFVFVGSEGRRRAELARKKDMQMIAFITFFNAAVIGWQLGQWLSHYF